MKLRKVIVGICVVCQTIITVPNLQAASDSLANEPLFLGTQVKPNVFVITDDSTSMDAISNWEEMEAKGEPYKNGAANGNKGGNGKGEENKNEGNNKSQNVAWDLDWRVRSISSNPLAYDPKIVYKPWPGTDSSGNPLYLSVTKEGLTSVPDFLLSSTNTSTVNVTATEEVKDLDTKEKKTFYIARYYVRSGTPPTDGIVRYSDLHSLVEIKSSQSIYPRAQSRGDCSAVPNICTYDEEIINFANWYKYHRRRAHMSINATGHFVNNASGMYLNLETMHTSKNAIVMEDVDSSIGKEKIFKKVYAPLDLKIGTPLKSAIDRVGQFLGGTSSPILPANKGGACQQNYTILMTDGYWTDNKPTIGNIDAGQPLPYGDAWSDTLADFSMKYYGTDLRSDLDNMVPAKPGIDDADWQHLVTYTIGLNVLGTMNSTTTNPTASGFAWKDPSKSDLARGDDLWHAALNGRGKFYNPKYPAQLLGGFSEILNNVTAQGANSSLALNSYTTLGDSKVVYRSSFDARKWHGDITAYKFDTTTNQPVLPSLWSAANELNKKTPDARNIITYSATSKKGTAFRWDNISIAHKNDLNTGPAAADENGQKRLNYLRGDRSEENNLFRSRDSSSIIGDIIHSTPVYVGAPSFQYLDVGPAFPAGENAYSTYKQSNEKRQGVVYVGANDGMMHGFSATTGEELLAYIPTSILSTKKDRGLHFLTDAAYQHRYYVDASPSIWDAYIPYRGSDGAVVSTPAWRTILIGSLGAGGRGIFALDVTNPADLKESNAAKVVMWEFSKADNSNLGFSFSKPIVTLLKTGSEEYRWAAIFGNGYDDSSDGTTDGQAKLFILFLDGGLDGVWTPGSDYIEINTLAGSTTTRNGLSSPAILDVTGDGLADRVYAGDLLGNMWAFDISSVSTTDWKIAYKKDGLPTPLFTAIKEGKPQPIAAAPTVSRYPLTGGVTAEPNVLVLFGTGQYLTVDDVSNNAIQTFYGIWDRGQPLGNNRTALLEQTLITDTSNPDVRTISDNTMVSTGDSANTGWYLDLSQGERVVASPVVVGDQVYFSSMIPKSTPCSSGGSGWLTSVNIENGGAKPIAVGSGTQASNALLPGESKKLEGGLPNTITAVKGSVVVSTTGGTVESIATGQPSTYKGVGRQSWREIRR